MKVNFGILQQIPDTIAGVKVLIFRPKVESDTKRPGIVYYHGGGWTILSPGKEQFQCSWHSSVQSGSLALLYPKIISSMCMCGALANAIKTIFQGP